MKKLNVSTAIRNLFFQLGESLWRYFHLREQRFKTFELKRI